MRQGANPARAGRDRPAARGVVGRTLLAVGVGVAAGLSLGPRAARAQPDAGGFDFGGGIYLFHYQPVDLDGADERTEIYALYLDVDRTEGPWTLHIQGRWRDTKLRSFFPSNVWIQEAWIEYAAPLGTTGEPAPVGLRDARGTDARPMATFRAGKLYQRLGRFWDGSFFGNIHYFDGLKLDPALGLEAELELPLSFPFGAGRGTFTVHGQWLLDDDRVNGALPGRDVESLGEAEEAGVTAGAGVRVPVAAWKGDPLTARLRVSGLAERVEWTPGGSEGADEERVEAVLEHLAVDVELAWRETLAYAEWSRRADGGADAFEAARPGAAPPETGSEAIARGVAGSRARWWLVGGQAGLGPVSLRYNFSAADYDDAGFRERLHQPGVTVTLASGVSALVEYDDWSRTPTDRGDAGDASPSAAPADLRIDRSLSFVLLLRF